MKILEIKRCGDCSTYLKQINSRIPHMACTHPSRLKPLAKRFDAMADDCPLEDYNPCECEPFQSCEKCSEKTEWKKPDNSLEFGRSYWVVCVGNEVEKAYFESHSNEGPGYCFITVDGNKIENVTMYAECKNPEYNEKSLMLI